MLTNGLLGLLKHTPEARVVVLGSVAYKAGTIDFENLSMKKGYTASAAYCRAKLCNLLFTRELAKRLSGTGVTINCVHPGAVATNILIKTDAGLGHALIKLFHPIVKTAEEGAKNIVSVATSTNFAHISGEYISGGQVTEVKGKAKDEALAKKLWDVSAKIVSDSGCFI